MITFKEYSTVLLGEAKFREQPSPSLMRQIKKVAKLYEEKYRVLNDSKLPEMAKAGVVRDFKNYKHWKTYFDSINIKTPEFFRDKIATIKVLDLETQEEKKIQVIVVYGDVTDEYASYSDNFETINIFNSNMNDIPLPRIESIMLHEITHGFQQYKGSTEKFRQNMENQGKDFSFDVYYGEPIEFDAHLNEIAFSITQRYKSFLDNIKKAKEPNTKKILQNRLNVFLQELKVLIKADPEAYFKLKELTLPSYLKDFEFFLKAIKNNPPLWRKFKTKMVNLYNTFDPEGLKQTA